MENIETKTRNSSFELLRIISMLLIIMTHFWQFGIYFPKNYPTNFLFHLSIMLRGWSGSIGNMLFILISGYFLCQSTFKWEKVLKLWFQVFSTSIIIALIFYFFKIQTIGYFARSSYDKTGWLAASAITKKDLIKSLFPILLGNNWFASKYLVFYLFIPVLNSLLPHLDKTKHFYLSVLLVLFGAVTKMIPGQGLADPSNIYYFFMGYFLASYIRIYNPPFFDNTIRNLILGILLIFFFCFWNELLYILSSKHEEIKKIKKFLDISSDMSKFPVVLAALFLLCGFKNLNIKNSKIINTIGATTFGVYLIHVNGFLKIFIWHKLFNTDKFVANPCHEILFIIFSILSVFILCSLLELVRKHTIDALIYPKLKKLIAKVIKKNENI